MYSINSFRCTLTIFLMLMGFLLHLSDHIGTQSLVLQSRMYLVYLDQCPNHEFLLIDTIFDRHANQSLSPHYPQKLQRIVILLFRKDLVGWDDLLFFCTCTQSHVQSESLDP